MNGRPREPPADRSLKPQKKLEGAGNQLHCSGLMPCPGSISSPRPIPDELDVARPRQAGPLAAGVFFCPRLSAAANS